jgi:hypothetical protein
MTMTRRPMSTSHRAVALTLLIFALALPLVVAPDETRASAKGPFPGFTGAPDEDTCRHCHDSFPINSPGGSLDVEGFPDVYELGRRYSIMIRLASEWGLRWGFQATTLDARDKKGGKLQVTDPLLTKKVRGYFIPDRIYVEQKKAGTYPGITGGVSWTFDWIAPTADKGPITLYVSGNAANNNGNVAGDQIYFAARTAVAPAAASR